MKIRQFAFPVLAMFKRIGIDWSDGQLIRNLYMNQSVEVGLQGVNSQHGRIGTLAIQHLYTDAGQASA